MAHNAGSIKQERLAGVRKNKQARRMPIHAWRAQSYCAASIVNCYLIGQAVYFVQSQVSAPLQLQALCERTLTLCALFARWTIDVHRKVNNAAWLCLRNNRLCARLACVARLCPAFLHNASQSAARSLLSCLVSTRFVSFRLYCIPQCLHFAECFAMCTHWMH